MLSKKDQTKKKARLKGEREFLLPDYYNYIRSVSGEAHHVIPRSRIGTNDFFIVPLTPEQHREVHTQIGVNAFIEEMGGEEKVIETCNFLFGSWIQSLDRTDKRFKTLLDLWFYIDTADNITLDEAILKTRECATILKENQ